MTEVLDCGCTFGQHASGARHRVYRCVRHTRQCPVQNIFTEKKYSNMGVLAEETQHVAELERNIGLPPEVTAGHLIEFGAGVSPYTKMVRDRGYSYTAVDSSSWACSYMREHHAVEAHCCNIDQFEPTQQYDVALAAHVLEHVTDAPSTLAKFNPVLVPGGSLYLIIPDDQDLMNQDHNWFFTVAAMTTMLAEYGFDVERYSVEKIVPQEDFIYCLARKTT